MTQHAPPLGIRLDLPADPVSTIECGALPAKPGLFVFEDCNGGTLALATTANMRRTVTAKLHPVATTAGSSRRVEYRGLARTILATTVGSAFEADWAYLQFARMRLPATYRGLLDRWQAWF